MSVEQRDEFRQLDFQLVLALMYARRLLLDRAEYEFCINKSGAHAFFYDAIEPEEIGQSRLLRIVEVQRSLVIVSDGVKEWTISPGSTWHQLPADQRPTIGDWVLLDEPRQKIVRLLERYLALALEADYSMQAVA